MDASGEYEPSFETARELASQEAKVASISSYRSRPRRTDL